jgi:hypothetical protein
MTLAARAALAALPILLVGCPIPQGLPEYPDSGTVAPPRIRADATAPVDTLILVAPDCINGGPVFQLSSVLVDDNTLEKVEARWFLDYDPGTLRRLPLVTEEIPGPDDGVTRTRPVTAFPFNPYEADPASDPQGFRDGGGVHVMELVVSNGFAPEPGAGEPPLERPWRTPLPNFETQAFRWVFHYGPGGTCSGGP